MSLQDYWSRSHGERELIKADEKAVRRDNSNPNIVVFGKGPMAKTCGGCRHLFSGSKNRLFCEIGRIADKEMSHRASWPACARFEQAEGGAR